MIRRLAGVRAGPAATMTGSSNPPGTDRYYRRGCQPTVSVKRRLLTRSPSRHTL